MTMQAQNKEIRKLYRTAKRSEQTQKIKLPGILLDIGLLFAKKDIKAEPAGKEVYRSIKKFNKFRLVASDDKEFLSDKKTLNLSSRVRSKMELLISIQTPDDKFNFLIKERKSKIKKIVILGNLEDSFILLAANCNISLSQLNKIIQTYSKDIDKLEILP